MKQAACVLKEMNQNQEIGKNQIICFLNRHPQIVTHYSSLFDKNYIKDNNSHLLKNDQHKIGKVEIDIETPEYIINELDEQQFMKRISKKVKVLCL